MATLSSPCLEFKARGLEAISNRFDTRCSDLILAGEHILHALLRAAQATMTLLKHLLNGRAVSRQRSPVDVIGRAFLLGIRIGYMRLAPHCGSELIYEPAPVRRERPYKGIALQRQI